MAEKIEVLSLLAPSEVLDRLARYGKEWRESKIPPSARGKFFGCRITVRGHEFELELEPQGNGGVFVWRGQVEADATNGGSRIHARATLKRWYAIISVIAVVLFIVAWDGPQLVGAERSVDRAVFAIGGTCMMSIVAWAITAGRAAEQGHACEAIFAQILSTSADVRPVAT
jgi:hypothetical protein